jgi:UDP-N-acetylmuramoylalanine--D-glutamate ligase
MRAADIGLKRVAVWGLGREGRAAISFLRQRHPGLPLLVLDDAEDG